MWYLHINSCIPTVGSLSFLSLDENQLEILPKEIGYCTSSSYIREMNISANTRSLLFEIKQVLYGGESTSEEINNAACFNYLSKGLATLDTSIAVLVITALIAFARKHYTTPQCDKWLRSNVSSGNAVIKTLLLICLSMVLGVEIGFKLASMEAIFFLFFCHIITVIEIYLLAVQPSAQSTSVLRCLFHILHLAFFGIVFMDDKGRQFHGEVAVSWIQHLLIYIVVPPYLVYSQGMKVLEPLTDFSYASITAAAFLILCYFVHQPISLVTGVNLNFVLCPISPYPFEGPYYRLAALFQQTALILTMGKVYKIILNLFISSNDHSVKEVTKNLH